MSKFGFVLAHFIRNSQPLTILSNLETGIYLDMFRVRHHLPVRILLHYHQQQILQLHFYQRKDVSFWVLLKYPHPN